MGSPFVKRGRIETELLVGLFLNTWPCGRTSPVTRVFESCSVACKRSLWMIFERGPIRKTRGGTAARPKPLQNARLSSLLQHAHVSRTEVRLAGAAVEPSDPPEVSSLFDLTLYATNGGWHSLLAVQLRLSYSARISEMLAQLVGLLEQIAESPDRRIHSYSLVTASQGDCCRIRRFHRGARGGNRCERLSFLGGSGIVRSRGRRGRSCLDLRRSCAALEAIAHNLESGPGSGGRRRYCWTAELRFNRRMLGVSKWRRVLTLDPSLPGARKLMLSEADARWVVHRVRRLRKSPKSLLRSLPVAAS